MAKGEKYGKNGEKMFWNPISGIMK